MKQVLVFTAILILAATSSFAATTDVASGATGTMSLTNSTGLELHAAATGDTAAKTTALIGKCSTGVGVGWATNVNGYTLVTQHKSGSKAYGTSYDSTSMFQTISDTSTPGTEILDQPTDTSTVDFTTAKGWKKM